MIDATRWILTEAWLSLGLRVEWLPSYETHRKRDWQQNESRMDIHYEGGGLWYVLPEERVSTGYPRHDVPVLATETLKHELAHYLVASADERKRENFGMTEDSDAQEQAAIMAERVINAMIASTSRIANLALGGRA